MLSVHLSLLMKLPTELHYEILSYLDLDDHPAAILVCPLWKDILSSGILQEKRLNSYTRSSCIGKWFIVNSILRSGKLKLKMDLNPPGTATNIQFFWKPSEKNNDDCFKITDDCPILGEAAVSWPVDGGSCETEVGVIYGAIEDLKISHHWLRKMLLFQDRTFVKDDVITVRDLAVGCGIEAVLPLLGVDVPQKEACDVQFSIQIIDVRVRNPVNCFFIQGIGSTDGVLVDD
ncbi:hypothetical protein TWF506_009338 [Arthrobotrys conoides]|uniref:F-box domain-containing protein n=1 Tax=Arthrobotrys conoides TaxID=74498 RepID=A0AAN8PEN1_9PEZI